MKNVELIADLAAYLARSVRREVAGLSREELTWQAHSVSVDQIDLAWELWASR